MPVEKVYTVPEAAELLKTSGRNIYLAIRSGRLNTFMVGREYRLTESALGQFMNAAEKKEGKGKSPLVSS